MKLKLTTALLGASALMMSASSFAVVDGIIANSITSRNASMGANYFSMEDRSDIWINPAYVVKYAGNAYIEDFRGTIDATGWGGANVETPFGIIGLYLGRDYWGPSASFGNLPSNAGGGAIAADPGTLLAFGPLPSLENKLDVLYGMDIGAFDVGLRLNMNGFSESQNNPTAAGAITAHEMSLSMSQINISAGLRMKDMPLDAGVLFSLKGVEGKSIRVDE
ncbi:MAG: hypothetical protein OEY38_17355 [Gammaproteobacteria bacterium]|nr:hypothetical protein [Gammaproteobacteria bacterium]